MSGLITTKKLLLSCSVRRPGITTGSKYLKTPSTAALSHLKTGFASVMQEQWYLLIIQRSVYPGAAVRSLISLTECFERGEVDAIFVSLNVLTGPDGYEIIWWVFMWIYQIHSGEYFRPSFLLLRYMPETYWLSYCSMA
ncbi:hypothetical protein [Cronobacter universalis]|uniref:hypothetical protein n=1 Tax=Cronobacter universalis TaxID=535744 RepID=UPI003CFA0622